MSINCEVVLITGAAGNIGTMLRSRLCRPERTLRLLDISAIRDPRPDEEVIRASICDQAAMFEACRGVKAVVHLAGHSGERSWPEIVENNIDGSHSVFEAARRTGVRRIVYASSNHVVGFYERAEGHRAPDYTFPHPDSYYAVGKAAVEALAAHYHHRHGIDVICLRLLSCADQPTNLRMLATWLSPDDAGRLFNAALTVAGPIFKVVWGVSDNQRAWFSLEEARAIGYRPMDDAERFAGQLIKRFGDPDPSADVLRFVGGPYCLGDYS